MKIKSLIRKSIGQRTLLTDIFGYSLTKLGFADKYLAGQLTMYKSYSWVKKHFKKDLKQIQAERSTNQPGRIAEKRVWICWLQGMENAPKIVQDCYESVCYWMRDWKITVISEENIKDYVQLPDYIIKKWNMKIIPDALFSDILRLELLIRYGGLWLDGTVLMTGKIPTYITSSNFFMYRNGWMDMEMINTANWLIYSKYTNFQFLIEVRDLLYRYWERYSFVKNYFIFHMFFRMVTDANKELWEQVPMINHIDSHFLMQELPKKYDERRCQQIIQLTSIHKLTYKVQTSPGSTAERLKELFKNKQTEWVTGEVSKK